MRAAALGLAAALVVAGCGGPEPDASEFGKPVVVAPGAPLVLMVGDSITEQAQDQISAAFTARGWNHAVVGHRGTTISENQARLRGAVTKSPKVLVVELGTNDLGQASQPKLHPSADDRADAFDEALSSLDDAVDDLSSLKCVVWVNVTEWTNFFGYDTTKTGPKFNKVLASIHNAEPWFHVADYASVYRPDTPQRQAELQASFDSQGLHPSTPQARQRWVDMLADSVHTSCAI